MRTIGPGLLSLLFLDTLLLALLTPLQGAIPRLLEGPAAPIALALLILAPLLLVAGTAAASALADAGEGQERQGSG